MPVLLSTTPTTGSVDAIQSAVSSALSSTQSDVMETIATVAPYGLAILGAILVITIGIKVFKKISGK